VPENLGKVIDVSPSSVVTI
jgi:hypothetical protein